MTINFIKGKNVNLRLVNEFDAEFIINLRLKKGEFLSQTDPDIKKQKDWISQYKIRENNKKEYYFIIQDKSHKKVGTVRIYDIINNSFSWGSWLIIDNSSKFLAIESALLLYDFAFNKLNFKKSHFDVRKGNHSVIRFHKNFGATVIRSNDKDHFFILKKDDYLKYSKKYQKFIYDTIS